MKLLAYGAACSLAALATALAAGCVDTTKPGSETPPGAGGPASIIGDCSNYPSADSALSFGARVETDPVPSELAAPAPAGPYRWQNVTIKGGGFVSGIVFSLAAPNLVYARTDVGGAYRYDVASGAWRPLTDWVQANESNLMGIESIAADPVDAGRVYLAAGTYLGAGDGLILSSSDYGASFERHYIGVPMGGNTDGRSMGERLAVDPNAPEVVYFGSRNDGLLISRDRAATWQAVSDFPVRGALDQGVTLVLFDARSGSAGSPTPTLYAGVARLAEDDANGIASDGRDPRNPAAALYWSRDAGQSWAAVPGQPGEGMPHHAALDAGGQLYVTYGDRPGPNDIRRGAVWRFDPDSGEWLDVSPPRPSNQRGGFAGLGVDPSHPGVVMVSTIDVWPDEIFRSTSAGACWTRLTPLALHDSRGADWLRFGGNDVSATGWMGDLEIDPFDGRRVLYITGQGVWSSEDASLADVGQATEWAFHNDGLEETVALGLASPPDGAPLLSAVGDIAGFRHDDFSASPPGGMFDNPVFGNTTSLDFAEALPSFVVRVGTHQQRRGAFSSDGGTSWTPFATEPPGSTGEGPVAVSADGASIVWDPRGAAPHYSRDRGASWLPVSGVMPPDGNAGALVSDRIHPARFYARSGGNVFVSDDGGASFRPAASNVGMGGGARLRTSFAAEGDVWVSSNAGLWHSTNAAQSFERLPEVGGVAALGFGRAAPAASFPAVYLAGTVSGQIGVFRSDDAGVSWVAIHDSRHAFGYINHVTGDPRVYGRVYLGTGGRGIVVGEPAAAPAD